MFRLASHSSPRLRRLRSVAVVLLAAILQVQAGSGVPRLAAAAAGEGFRPPLCTSHGLVAPDAPLPSGDQVHGHDCCAACGIGPLPFACAADAAVSPAPTFTVRAGGHPDPVLPAPYA